jgi:hypothetical protein
VRYLAAYDGSENVTPRSTFAGEQVAGVHDVRQGTGERHAFVEGEPRTLCDRAVDALYVPEPEEEWAPKHGNCAACEDVLAPK